ncbi:MAG TPA: hypothetical protein VK742_07115 [Candidatus Sulfotelmatobacter sp.]|jgi:hypothetical protein|nr:hypothetical protein [Candidatus Sulfotelmatobacter sp.]
MPSVAAIWIWFCAYLNCAGWTLSTLHELNARGYLCVFAIGILGVLAWKKISGARLFPKIHPLKFRRRFKKAFPLAFLILAGLAFLGGALYAPVNFDALAYRTPRVLNWLAAGQWHWIHTDFNRLNTRTAGFEWLTAPQFLFLHSDRFIFLLNTVSFLLLPGRIFAVLTRLGVRPRAAWHWMWLLPSGYGYVLQAGSILNDMFGAVLTLAAFEFALRSREKSNFSNFAASTLAAALMTAVKAFNIVLLLPWALALFLPGLKIFPRRPLATVVLAVFAASASMLPTAYLNWRACGDWTGLKAEQATIGGGAEGLRLSANLVSLTTMNLVPPVFPFTRQWENLMDRVTPANLSNALRANMEPGLAKNRLSELQVEEISGLGCGVSVLLLAMLAWKLKKFPRVRWPGLGGFKFEFLFFAATWLGAIVMMMKSGAAGPARYFLPVYPLLVLPLLDGGAKLQGGSWRTAGFLIFFIAGALVVAAPQRPLWPALTLLKKFDAERSQNVLLQRACTVYSVYEHRGDSFAPALEKLESLPDHGSILGFIGIDEPEGAVWKPFGSRQVVHLCADDSAAAIRSLNLQYALICADYLDRHVAGGCEHWQEERGGETVATFVLKIRAGQPPENWRLVRFP